ncbi:MAG: hypothetical protein QM820_51625 [Minicystis sp.]
MDDAPYEALEALAQECGRSVAEIVGDLVRQYVAPGASPPRRSLSDIEGIVEDAGASGVDPDVILYGASKRG